MQSKAGLRKITRAKLQALTAAEIAEKSTRICARLLDLPQWAAAKVICLFAAQATEPDLAALWRERGGKTFVYPRVNGVLLDLLAVDDPSTLQTSRWQLREPMHDEAKIIASHDVDLFLVPGLAFTKNGARLGRGGGFYDRLFAQENLHARKVGICFDVQIFDDLPREPHDCLMDAVTTESETISN